MITEPNGPKRKKAISIADDAELKKLLNRLVKDIIEAGGYARLHQQFRKSFSIYDNEIQQTPFFWTYVEVAVREACLHRLSRIYDQDLRALSLRTLLNTIGGHSGFFEDDPVLKRVSLAYADEFKPGSHRLDPKRLEADILLVTASDPLVNKLVIWRNSSGAHLSTTRILNANAGNPPDLTWEEVSTLVERAFNIFNHYLTKFEGSSWAKNIIIGEESTEFLFKLLRLGIEKYDDLGNQWRQK